MYHKILVPMALDHGISPQTLQAAQTLCADGGEIIALHVYEAPQGSVQAYLDEAAVKQAFERARKQLEEKLADLTGITPVLVKGHTARTIIDYAKTEGVDCVVIGSHRPGLRDYFLGSTAAWVVRHAPCAVHVHRSH